MECYHRRCSFRPFKHVCNLQRTWKCSFNKYENLILNELDPNGSVSGGSVLIADTVRFHSTKYSVCRYHSKPYRTVPVLSTVVLRTVVSPPVCRLLPYSYSVQ